MSDSDRKWKVGDECVVCGGPRGAPNPVSIYTADNIRAKVEVVGAHGIKVVPENNWPWGDKFSCWFPFSALCPVEPEIEWWRVPDDIIPGPVISANCLYYLVASAGYQISKSGVMVWKKNTKIPNKKPCWTDSAFTPDQIRQHCQRVPTEHEAIHGVAAEPDKKVRYFAFADEDGVYRLGVDDDVHWREENEDHWEPPPEDCAKAVLAGRRKEITEARANEILGIGQAEPEAEPEPAQQPAETPTFEVGQYITRNDCERRVISYAEYRKAGGTAQTEQAGYFYTVLNDGILCHWPLCQQSAFTLWHPAVGEKVWVDGLDGNHHEHCRGFGELSGNKYPGGLQMVDIIPFADEHVSAVGIRGWQVFPLSSIHPAAFAPKEAEKPAKPECTPYAATKVPCQSFATPFAPKQKPAEPERRWFKDTNDGELMYYPSSGEGWGKFCSTGQWFKSERTLDDCIRRSYWHEFSDSDALAYIKEQGWRLPPCMEQPEPTETDVPEPIAQPEAVDGREWFLDEHHPVLILRTVKATIHISSSQGSKWSNRYLLNEDTKKILTEQQAIAFMQKHSIPWPDCMGPKCWICGDALYLREREDGVLEWATGSRFEFSRELIENDSGWQLTTEPAARRHCNMDATPKTETEQTTTDGKGEKMGPRCWIDKDTAYYYRECGNGEVEQVSRLRGVNRVGYSLVRDVETASAYHEVTEAEARAHIGLEPLAETWSKYYLRDKSSPAVKGGVRLEKTYGYEDCDWIIVRCDSEEQTTFCESRKPHWEPTVGGADYASTASYRRIPEHEALALIATNTNLDGKERTMSENENIQAIRFTEKPKCGRCGNKGELKYTENTYDQDRGVFVFTCGRCKAPIHMRPKDWKPPKAEKPDATPHAHSIAAILAGTGEVNAGPMSAFAIKPLPRIALRHRIFDAVARTITHALTWLVVGIVWRIPKRIVARIKRRTNRALDLAWDVATIGGIAWAVINYGGTIYQAIVPYAVDAWCWLADTCEPIAQAVKGWVA